VKPPPSSVGILNPTGELQFSKGPNMSLLKNIKEKKQKQAAKSLYDRMPKIKGDPREIRKLRSLITARIIGFIDTTFIEGAKNTEALQNKNGGIFPGLRMNSAAYKNIKTIGGVVCVYLPSQYSDYFYELGSLYQRENLTINQVIEFADEMCGKISTSLDLENNITALSFLRSDSTQDSKNSTKMESNDEGD